VLAIGDVIGKGPSAALNTATITSVWKRFEPTFETSPEDLTPLLSELARVIEDSYRGEQTTSIQLAALYHDRIRIISCAAPQWVKVPAVGAASRIRNRPVNPLGMKVDRARYQFVECEVASGDVFIAHTDGVMEGTDCFVRFSSSLKAKAGEGRRLEFQEFVDAARASGKGAVLPDDFTMIMIRRDGQGVEHALSDQKVG
jgi:serine phosphatase RsbU (regulator of sigma subunit)